jgi:hypothetical protein
MSQNLATKSYIFPTGMVVPNDLGLNERPLRSVSTNLADNNVYEDIIDYYDTPIANPSNKYDNLAVRQSQIEYDTNVVSNMDFVYYNQIKNFFKNRQNLIIFSSILFVIVIVAVMAVIMIVLATASKII